MEHSCRRDGEAATCDARPLPSPETAAALPGIGDMVRDVLAAAAPWDVSNFWLQVGSQHAELLADGFAEFKRSVNAHYLQWAVYSPVNPRFRAALRRARPSEIAAAARSRIVGGQPQWFGPIVAAPSGREPLFPGRTFAAYSGLLTGIAERRLGRELPEEPDLGSPIRSSYRGRRVTQDGANSALELASILEAVPAGRLENGLVLEVGAGYGRLAWLALTLMPRLRYVIVDVPPTLAVSQRYLTSVLPDRKVFRHRPFADPTAVEEELAEAQIAFLTPRQLALLPPLDADVFVNISSLHEMRMDQVAAYLEQAERHTRGWFYSRQWEVSMNGWDGAVIEQDDYPYPDAWERVYERPDPIQCGFFEALYRTGSGVRSPTRTQIVGRSLNRLRVAERFANASQRLGGIGRSAVLDQQRRPRDLSMPLLSSEVFATARSIRRNWSVRLRSLATLVCSSSVGISR